MPNIHVLLTYLFLHVYFAASQCIVNSCVLVTTSSYFADRTPRVTVTSSNDECETLIRTTSLPLPDSETTEGDIRGKSTPAKSFRRLDFSHSLPADAKKHRRHRPFFGVLGHVSQTGADPSTCVFDNRVYSPGGSTSSRCSDDDDDDDETVTSPIVSREPLCRRYSYVYNVGAQGMARYGHYGHGHSTFLHYLLFTQA